jgi:DNA-binding response OmpR family regulator
MPNDKKPEPSELMERGIDDCITKPFSTAVIKAKVFTIFTRQKKRHAFLSGIRSSVSGMDNVVAFQDRRKTVIDNYVFDFESGDYSVGGRKVELNELETNILYTLVINRGMVIRKRAFVEKLRNQNHGYYVDEGVLAEIIDRLTHELCAENYIKIVYGIGYMWIRLEENTNV